MARFHGKKHIGNMENSDMENGPVEIVDLPIEYGDVP
jgi:hypothetical protein